MSAGAAATPIPPRSRLRGLELLGRGTALAEHAASLVVRTAWRNGVAPRAIIDDLGAEIAAEVRAFAGVDPVGPRWNEYLSARHSVGLLGTNRAAATVVDTLARLSLRPAARAGTLLDLALVLPPFELLSERRKVCRECLADWHRTGRDLYEPMLFQFAAVTVCPVHGCRLEAACPNPGCGKERWVLTADAVPGYCAKCGADLWTLPRTGPARWDEPEHAWALWVATELGGLVAALSDLAGPVDPAHLGDAMRIALGRTAGTLTGLARALGVSKSSVSLWLDGYRTASLGLVLRVCRLTGLHVADFLLGNLAALEAAPHPDGPVWLPDRHRSYDRHDLDRLARAMAEAMQPGVVRSLRGVAAEAGFDPSFVRRRYPAESRELGRRVAEHLTRRRAERFAQQRDEVRAIMRALHLAGVYPSVHQVRRRMRLRIPRRDMHVIWREEIVALGYPAPDGRWPHRAG